MSVISESASSTKSLDLDKKAAAASAALIEKMRASAEEKAKKLADREAKKAQEAAEKAEKAAKKDAERAEKAAKKEKEAAEKAAKKAERDAARAAKESAPKLPRGRPRKNAASAADSDTHSVSSVDASTISAFNALKEPVPVMRHIALPDLEMPALAPATMEELAAENARLRDTVAKLKEMCERQRYAISHAFEFLSTC
jgi:hypothetical protein